MDILLTATSPRMPIGVLQNDPSAGQEATVKCIGFSKVVGVTGGSLLQNGALLTASNSGALAAASAVDQDLIFGIWFNPDVSSGSAFGNALINFSMAGITGCDNQFLNTVN
jgi:hypothetical protein